MSAAPDLGVDRSKLFATRRRTSGLTNGLSERNEIVNAARRRIELAVMPDEFPSAGRGQAACVLLAEVIRVRLIEGGKRTDDGGRLGVDIGQRRDCQTWAAVARATPW
jgi:hypothetical protein